MVNEVARDVMDYADWQGLTKLATIAGDGVVEVFDLPADYARQLLRSDIQDTTSWLWGYEHCTDINDFLHWKDRGFTGLPGAWILYQDKLNFAPAPTGNATYPYISRNYAVDSGTLAAKPVFDADTDAFILDERLLTLGLVWRWREQKKLDFAGDQEAFTLALSVAAAKDKGSRVYRRGRRFAMRGTHIAWPWTLGGV